MFVSDTYDVPESIVSDVHSPTFAKFLRNWFSETGALTHGELDITFLRELTPDELSLARELIRRNLRLKYNHIIEGAAALHDPEAVPILRELLAHEGDMSRRLMMAWALWQINRDPIFVECLQKARLIDPKLFVSRHLDQVLWLEDGRALDFLIGLLEVNDGMVLQCTLSLLNRLESGRPMLVHHSKMLHQPADYREMQNDPAFRAQMVAAICRRNAESTNGW
jgi:hypothetical protein